MDRENITIYENDLVDARVLCGSIEDSETRNKTVACTIGAKIASRSFNGEDVVLDIESGIHNVPKVVSDYDISDIYINDSYIDVRVYFSSDELCIPRLHFDYNILPSAYMFVKLSPDLAYGSVTGFIKPENVNKSSLKDNYYYADEASLVSFGDLELQPNIMFDESDINAENIYKYLEASLGINEEITLIKQLLESKEARSIFLKALKAESVFNFISTPAEQAEAIVDDIENVEIPEIEDDVVEDGTENSLLHDLEYSTEVTPSGADVINSLDREQEENVEQEDENSDQIDTLFNGEQTGIPVPKKKGSSKFPLLLIVLLIALGGGYWWYTNMYNKPVDNDAVMQDNLIVDEVPSETQQAEEPADAMPNETVDTVQEKVDSNEVANSVSIPSIEQHLDASVLVSNLKVDWEVPAGYASNTAAKRYLVKLGKIIQLNLKTELLLLTKPPISNKIAVELKFNPNIGKFEVVGIQNSSGEKTVDETILYTIKNALTMNLSSNIESFGKIQGNPILVIKL